MITVRRIFAAASLALCMTAFNACVKEEVPEQLPVADDNLVEITFEAPSVGAKSTFDGEARKINWELTDKVAVYDGTARRQFNVTAIENGVATLKGYVAEGATEFYAVYPYSAAGDELPVDGAINIIVPQEQTLAEGKNFDEDAFVTVGKVENGSIAFKNVVSLLKVNIPADVTSVKLISYSTEKFAGAATAKTDWTTTAGNATSVVLKPSAATFAEGEHYIALLPTTFEKGFRVVYEQASQLGVSKTTSKVVFPVNGGQSITGSTPSWIPTVITNETQLRNYFANQDLFGATEVKLGQNIALTSAWTPVTLTGKLDGAEYTISGLDVEVNGAGTLGGMFTTIDTDASLKNITIEGTVSFSTSAATSYAGLAGELKGTMYKVINKASVTVASTGNNRCYPGGLVGVTRSGSIVECENHGAVTLSSASCVSFMGGLVGAMSTPGGLVQNSKNSGTVTSNSSKVEGLGGIVGIQQSGTVEGCTNSGTLALESGAANSYVGGITGYVQNRSTAKLLISNCTNRGTFGNFTTPKAVGGICGVIHRYCTASAEINGCKNETELAATITKSEFYLGGIVGRMANPGSGIGDYTNYIKNCENLGNVTLTKDGATQSTGVFVGGVIGNTLGTVELVGNKTLASSVAISDGYTNNRKTIVGGIVGNTDDSGSLTVSSNVNKAAVSCASTRGNNYVVLSGGIIGRCIGTLNSSNNINFGDVSVSNANGGTGKNPFAGGIVGEFNLIADETATLSGDKTFGKISSDCGRAGLICGVINGTTTLTLSDCVIGGTLNDPTNGYANQEITKDNFDDKTNMLVSYTNGTSKWSQTGTTFGTAE